MAAPSTWGNVVDDYGRIGISVNVSYPNSATASVSIEVWISTKYSATDSNNNFWFDDNAQSASTSRGSRSIKTTVNSGAWNTSNYQKIYTYPTFTVNRTTSNQTRYCAAKLSGVEIASGTMTQSVSYTIKALDSYNISYSPNGMSCTVPATHKKYYGISTTVSSAVPTTEGYTCTGWVTAAPEGKFYAFGAPYTANASAVLYANWVKNRYKITLDPNGGTINSNISPVVDEKEHGAAYALPSPIRKDHNFLGWSTSSTAATATYAPGASYTANTPVTLYAVWELAYIPPIITNVVVERADVNGNPTDEGTYFNASFNWATDEERAIIGMEVYIKVTSQSGEVVFEKTVDIVSLAAFYAPFSETALGNGSIDTEYSYTVSITVHDTYGGSSSVQRTIMPIAYPIDILAKGKGISFGGPAKIPGVADFKWPVTTDYIYSRVGKQTADNYGTYDSPVIILPTSSHLKFGSGTSAVDGEYFKALLKWICKEYKGVKYGMFIGSANPSTFGTVMINIYSTDDVNDDGLPRYSSGVCNNMHWQDICKTSRFGTNEYSFRYSKGGLDSYPVNSIYISYSHTSPAELFGGSWTRIADRFLYGIGGTGAIGETGGEKSHVLTISEMPQHQHELLNYNTGGDDTAEWTNSSVRIGDAKIGYNGNILTTFVGGGQAHNNMPPYIQVSIWRRTA